MKLNQFKIPKRFMSHGLFVDVVYRDNLAYERQRVGEMHLRKNEIHLQSSNDGIPRKQEQIEETFCHELMHHMFDKIGRSELSDDEVLVENCGSLLYQIFRTMEFEEGGDTSV